MLTINITAMVSSTVMAMKDDNDNDGGDDDNSNNRDVICHKSSNGDDDNDENLTKFFGNCGAVRKGSCQDIKFKKSSLQVVGVIRTTAMVTTGDK